MRIILFIVFLHACFAALGQDAAADSTRLLEPVLIQAYATDRPLSEVPASIGYISTENLNRFNNASILPAVNTIPGVRMEERSPGSYRFSIRGSSLRSPFGVRNVKMYWNGLPLTDGGGNTYLNLLDFNAISNLEIIKGPAGSLYGAGTGGVVLLNSAPAKKGQWDISFMRGSYGLQRLSIAEQYVRGNFHLKLQYTNQEYDGYREQTQMSRHAINMDAVMRVGKQSTLSATFFYTNLTYGTPGGLTKAQYDENPRQARPTTPTTPGSVDQKATVYNQTPYLGLMYEHEWDDRWTSRVGIFGSHSDFENPSLRNYELRDERNAGARTESQYRFGRVQKHKLTFGAEYQYFRSPVTDYDNNLGVKGNVQTDDKLSSQLLLIFGQTEFELPSQILVTVGASVTFLKYGFTRYQPGPETTQPKKFDPSFSPRIALLKKFSENLSVYANISRGFSPPSLAEVRPSTANFNAGLQSEYGTNYEIGTRGKWLQQKLSYDITLYNFALDQTILLQRTADNADYYVNAGKTSQRGAEIMLSWDAVNTGAGFLSQLKLWTSYSYNHYRFRNYAPNGTDYSGNKLTGVPPVVSTTGLDIMLRGKFYLNVTANYVDHIPMDDANTTFANEYFLLGSRIGYKSSIFEVHRVEIFAGIDNALDKRYSLGNDLNAVGGRYFNAAPGRNYYAGLKFSLNQ